MKTTKPPPSAGGDPYRKRRKKEADRQRQKAAVGKEIGGIPDIANVRRRARCAKSLRLFCETYNPEAFHMAWSEEHLRGIARIEEAATLGALFAFAWPRGSGKTTICRMAGLWAVSYAHCRYLFIVGANASKAEDNLAAIKTFARFLPLFADDFPEIAWPVRSLAGIANRAAGQTCGEQSTLIEWSKDRVILPTVPPPANWPKSWRLREDGMVPTSGSVVSAAGLTGEGIRGSLLTLSTGETIRPDFVLLDDPQTHESATSLTQNDTRLQLVSADVLGMAGPGKAISAVMPCTVIERGDMIDEVLDRTKHPLWRGERTKLLRSTPSDLDAWDAYFQVYRECVQLEPPDLARANAHYLAHREQLDAGAEASWPERKLAGEISAVQHAMHLYFRDPRAFAAEYQNEPLDVRAAGAIVELEPDQVAGKLNRVPRGLVPAEASRLTAAIDVQGGILFWMVAGWDDRFGGAVVDYGTYPEQHRHYFTARDARPSLAEQFPGVGPTGQIYAGLQALTAELLGARWERHEGGEPMVVERLLVDANWGASTETVYQFCRQSPSAALIFPSHGKGIGASVNPMASWPAKPNERRGRDWVLTAPGQGRGRHIVFDSNSWKSFVHERLRTAAGAPGCLWLPGDSPHVHQLLADHVTSEYRVLTHGRGRQVEEWKVHTHKPENHWLDTLVLCAVAASLQGLVWSPAAAAGQSSPPRKPGPPPKKFSEIYREKRAGR